MVTIKSNVELAGEMKPFWSMETISDEPMFFSADNLFAGYNSGPITDAFLRALPEDLKPIPMVPISSCLIDSKVHMLKPTWFPNIPGWHLDNVPRVDGQPDISQANGRYIITSVGTGVIPPTLFAIGELEFEYDPEQGNVYKQLNEVVDASIEAGDLALVEAKPGILYEMNGFTLHATSQSNTDCWRWFSRAAVFNNWRDKIQNKIRRNTQVYVPDIGEGW